MTDCVFFEALEYRSGSSDKVYCVVVLLESGIYETIGFNGRRGSTLTRQGKGTFSNDIAAVKEANNVVSVKKKGGYSAYSGGIPAGLPADVHSAVAAFLSGVKSSPSTAAAPVKPVPAPAILGPVPMLATALDSSGFKLNDLLASDTWVAQRKYDGERCLVSVKRGQITAYNRTRKVMGTLPLTPTKALSNLLEKSDFDEERECVLDGELMGEDLVVFDALRIRDIDVQHLPFIERYFMLEELLTGLTGLGLAPTAWDPSDKESLLQAASDSAWEGLIFRDKDAPYVGSRTKQLVKHKLWESATCRVLHTNDKRSVGLGLLDENNEDVFVGNVTIPVNQDIPEVYDLVEVRYLYAHAGGSLYQPTYQGVRKDKEDADLRSSLKLPPPEKIAA